MYFLYYRDYLFQSKKKKIKRVSEANKGLAELYKAHTNTPTRTT